MLKKRETVILLHGLARSSLSMRKLSKALNKAGYATVNYSYPSTRYSIETLSTEVIPGALSQCGLTSKVHFITHSMGGILLRHYLSSHRIAHLGRVVMLAPPNQGSELADWLKPYRLFRTLLGPAGSQLGTKADSIFPTLGLVEFESGIIAGTSAFNLLVKHRLPYPNDGTVSVTSTKIEGMSDHLCLPASHPFIMYDAEVIRQSIYFLKHGQFDR